MSAKLDPALMAMLDDPAVEPGREVVVLIGLGRPADETILTELRQSGLIVRSVIGDVLTGAALLNHILAISEHPEVVKIEAATPLQPEDSAPPLEG